MNLRRRALRIDLIFELFFQGKTNIRQDCPEDNRIMPSASAGVKT
jgi:hypothetical protein